MNRVVAIVRERSRHLGRERHIDEQLQPASGSSRSRTASAA
jgi:hypothetical protein